MIGSARSALRRASRGAHSCARPFLDTSSDAQSRPAPPERRAGTRGRDGVSSVSAAAVPASMRASWSSTPSITGYQEILTDPSYAGQIVTFTFPHIGNVGTNDEDIEALTPYARGMVARAPITDPSNWRSSGHLDAWLDSARHRRHRRGRHAADHAHPARARGPERGPGLSAGRRARPREPEGARARPGPSLEGMDLAGEVSCRQRYGWDETRWAWGEGYGRGERPRPARRGDRLRREAQHPAQPREPRLPGDGGARHEPPPRRCWRWRPTASCSPTAPATRPPPATMPCPRSGSWSTAASRCSASASATRCWAWHWAAGPRRCRSAITAPTTRSRT